MVCFMIQFILEGVSAVGAAVDGIGPSSQPDGFVRIGRESCTKETERDREKGGSGRVSGPWLVDKYAKVENGV